MNKEANIKPDPLSRDLESKTTLSDGSMQSCFRNQNENIKKSSNRRVSFPEDETDLVTGYLEPPNPWDFCENVNKEEVITNYLKSCEKHGSRPISSVLEQLQDLDFTLERNACLDLKGRALTFHDCETLEEILKRVQFISINLEKTSIDDESSVALFDMVEYYEAAVNLNISGNPSIGVQGWQACSRMIKRTKCLEELDAKGTTLNEQYMPILSRALRLSSQLVVLKLENCNLSGRPIVILAAALRLNTCLKELYVGENYLGMIDASQLGAMLKCNVTLQLLDISNNTIQDGGMKHIADGICDQSCQNDASVGLSVLILWNNHLSLNSSQHIAKILAYSKTLETLNVGQNILSNEVLFATKHVLQQNKTLLRLGMQSTHLTCEGAVALAEIIADNSSIERIDLRDNNLQVAGLMALVHSMKVNSSVTQLDLDDSPRRKYSGSALEEYSRLVKEIRSFCHRNEETKSPDTTSEDISEPGLDDSADDSTSSRQTSFALRKISLTCETLMKTTSLPPVDTSSTNLLVEPRRSGGRLRSPAPSPIPSPVASPSPTRSRFQVSRVSECDSPTTPPSTSPSPPTIFFGSNSSGTSSRFKVTVVDSAPVPTPTTVSTIVASNNVTKGFDTSAVTKPSPTVQSSLSSVDPMTKTVGDSSSPRTSPRSSPRTSPLRSRSDTEDSIDSPKSKLPKAMDSIDLSALRITKQVSVMSEKPAPRTRKISLVQASSMFTSQSSSSQSSQDDSGSCSAAPPSGKPSGLEKLLGLFSNPFSRAKSADETQQRQQTNLSSNVPERNSSSYSSSSDKQTQQPNCDNKNADIDVVKKTAGEFLEQTLNLFLDKSTASSSGVGSGVSAKIGSESSCPVDSSESAAVSSEKFTRSSDKRSNPDSRVIIEETDQELIEAARDSNNCSISNSSSSSNSSNGCASGSNRGGSTSSSDSSNLTEEGEEIEEPITSGNDTNTGKSSPYKNDNAGKEDSCDNVTITEPIFIVECCGEGNDDNNSNDCMRTKNNDEPIQSCTSPDLPVAGFVDSDLLNNNNDNNNDNNVIDNSNNNLGLAINDLEEDIPTKEESEDDKVDEKEQMGGAMAHLEEVLHEDGDVVKRRRRSEEEDDILCETWPQANKCLHRFGSASLDLHSSSAPCLTALVFLQGNVSSNLAAELKKISPTESSDSIDKSQSQQPQPSQQDIGVVL